MSLILINVSHSQSVCAPNGTTTNPANPVNPLQPSYVNNFDWTTNSSYYPINTTCTPLSYTVNPFESNQTELLPLSISKDMKPVDGWEMVAYNLGYDNNNSPLLARPEHSYVMLYNKYTGFLRILVKWCRNVNYNGALLTLKFAPGFQTNLLDMANIEKSLDTPHIVNPSLSTSLKFFNDNNFWAYADFKLNYDPCTCTFTDNSRLLLYSELISNSSVELTGKITGTISSISNGSGTTDSDGKFWKTASNINGKMMQVHKNVQSFANTYGTIYQNLADGGITINAINSLGSFLNNNAFMKAGLKAIPYASSAVKFLSGLFGGGASGQQPIQLAPLSVNLDVKISGSITTQDPMHNQTIGLPGSQQQNALLGTISGQPLYNETLGVFTLVNNPVMYYTDTNNTISFLNREKIASTFTDPERYFEILSDYNFKTRNYKLSGDALKYAINPASNLTLQDAEVMLIVEYEKPSLKYSQQYSSNQVLNLNTDVSNGLAITGTDVGPSVDVGNAIFQNAFRPIGGLNFKNDYSFSFLYDVTNVTSGTKNRELLYNQFGNPKWRCKSNNSTFQGSCPWTNGSNRPFSYEQTNTTLPSNWSSLTPSNFKSTNTISFLPNIGLTIRPEFLAPRVKQFKMKLVLNLKRTDNPNAQNVLYVVTYPITLLPAPVGYNMTGSNYVNDAQAYANQVGYVPAVPTNKFVQATQAELQSFCSSNAYKTGRANLSGRIGVLNENGDILDEEVKLKPILSPVPVKNILHVVTNNCRLLNIVDVNGKIIQDLSIYNNGNSEIEIDSSALTSGVYIVTFTNQKGEQDFIKFVK